MTAPADVLMRIPVSDGTALFPNFAKPIEIGHYSRDDKDQLRCDKSQLTSYCPPDNVDLLNLDLNDGYGRMIQHRHRYLGCLDDLLWWIKENYPANSGMDSLKNAVHGAEFVCWRGLLTKLSSTPFEMREGWMFGVVRFAGVIFMVEFETDAAKQRNASLSEQDKRFTYWGYRFERYVTKGSAKDSDKSIVDGNEQYCVVFRTKLSPAQLDSSSRQIRLLYGAETDCVDESGRYIELKTSRIIENWKHERTFKRFKLLKWWLQSFLAGIDRIVCGHRDDHGIVKYLKSYDVADMPKSASSAGWSSAECMKYLYELLLFVDTNTAYPAQSDCLGDIAVFEFDPKARLVRLVRNHQYTSDYILPSWFVSAFGRV